MSIPFHKAVAQKQGDGSYVVRVIHSIDGTSTDVTFPFGSHAASLAEEYALFKNEAAQVVQENERLKTVSVAGDPARIIVPQAAPEETEAERVARMNAATEHLLELGKKITEIEEKKAVSVPEGTVVDAITAETELADKLSKDSEVLAAVEESRAAFDAGKTIPAAQAFPSETKDEAAESTE